MNGKIIAICVTPIAGGQMKSIPETFAITGEGIKGDRYSTGNGSFNKNDQSKRQVTLMNSIFFKDSGFIFEDSRRNIFVEGVELMWLIGREFQIGDARMKGIKYCDPCNRPSKLCGKEQSFKEAFFDRGGIIAEVIQTGIIKVGDPLIPPPKGY